SVRYQSAVAIRQTAGVIEPLMPYVLRKLSEGNDDERWSAVTFLEASGAGHPADVGRAIAGRRQFPGTGACRQCLGSLEDGRCVDAAGIGTGRSRRRG